MYGADRKQQPPSRSCSAVVIHSATTHIVCNVVAQLTLCRTRTLAASDSIAHTLALLHNHRTRATEESLLASLGWQMMGDVSTQLGKIDRDKSKHHQIQTSPAYNGRQKALRVEKKTRNAEDPELIAHAATQKQKTREKQVHRYSARKLLYQAA